MVYRLMMVDAFLEKAVAWLVRLSAARRACALKLIVVGYFNGCVYEAMLKRGCMQP